MESGTCVLQVEVTEFILKARQAIPDLCFPSQNLEGSLLSRAPTPNKTCFILLPTEFWFLTPIVLSF